MPYTTAELLAPAGNPEALDAAIGEGADAVYLGLKNFNARLRTTNFAYNQFEALVESLHKQGKRVYVTANTVFEQREADRMYQFLQYLEKVGPDGIIVQDLGVAKMAHDNFPGLKLHGSTQMNVGTALGANYLSRSGFKRVVMSRELSLEELKGVRAETNMELETFVHGALCVSASGLCLFSSYLGGRSANRGACTQACRRLFREESRDGYFFSPDDLSLVEKVPDLVEAGIDTFKIEGRMKSSEYVGTVVAAYRYMLDNWRFDRERAAAKAASILQGDFARHKTTFWFDGSPAPDFIRPEQAGGTGISLGKVKVVRVFDEKRWMLVRGYDGIAEGDSIRIHAHDDSGRSTARVRGLMRKPEGLFLQVDAEFGPEDEIYLVQTKSMSRRYKPVLPSSLAKYHRFPSYDSAPKAEFPSIPKNRISALPDGLYVMVSRVQDLFTILADRPEKAMLRLSRKNAEGLRRHEKETPFKRETLALWLEPYFPQADAAWLSEELDYWIGKGQKVFVANNLGHLALLKGKDVTVIAGPWLYAFNAWAAAFLLGNGADFIVPPLEISKQDLARVMETVPAKCVMPTVFAYPQLFTIRADMGERYDFRFFKDREGDEYELVSSPDGSVVIPIKPFSLVDRIPYLRKDGMGKFIIDVSFIDLKKQVYKRIMAAARDGVVLPETGRFDWKEGFWNPEETNAPARAADSGERPRRDSGVRPDGGEADEPVRRGRPDRADRPGRGGKPVYKAEGDEAPAGRRGAFAARSAARGATRDDTRAAPRADARGAARGAGKAAATGKADRPKAAGKTAGKAAGPEAKPSSRQAPRAKARPTDRTRANSPRRPEGMERPRRGPKRS